MIETFRTYKARTIAFDELMPVGSWQVKVYTITPNLLFEAQPTLVKMKARLPELLAEAEEHHEAAFLIVHEGTDGLWSLMNWWTGREMLRTMTYFTSYDQPDELTLLPERGSMACVWELPVINHEKNAWVKNVLMQAEAPDLAGYFGEVMEGKI